VIRNAVLLLAAVATPAFAQYDQQAEADRRLAFVRAVTGDRSWACTMVSVGRPGPEVKVDMNLSLLPNRTAVATTTSRVILDGQTYSAVYQFQGRASGRPDGSATVDLSQSRAMSADALPDGASWSAASSVRLSLEIVPDPAATGRHSYMLQGDQTDNNGRAAISCVVRAGG